MQFGGSNILQVSVRFAYLRNNSFIYQRAIPRELRSAYGDARTVKVPLKTADPLRAAREVLRLNAEFEAEWNRLREDPSGTPKAAQAHSKALIRRRGLDRNCDVTIDQFFDYLDSKRRAHAAGDEDVYREAPLDAFLAPAEVEAVRILRGDKAPACFGDALAAYIASSGKTRNAKFTADSKRAVEGFAMAAGEGLALEAVKRGHVRAYIASELARGSKTATVRRRLNSLKAIFEHWRTETESGRPNPFTKAKIESEGTDATDRAPLSAKDVAAVAGACLRADDDLRWLLALLLDTGARLAEVAGLKLADVALGEDVPHIHIRPNELRPLKTAASARKVPLVGMSLWAAQRVVASAKPGQVYAFPRYASPKGLKAGAASAALNKWLRESLKVEHTCHELRHTMADRLRASMCQDSMREALQGWSSQRQADKYGSGYSLELRRDALLRVACVVGSGSGSGTEAKTP